jgi:hypothetical protein
MATTTNYGWTTPDDTALVKDGAAAIRTLGTSIDSTLKTQINAQIPDSLLTTTGDVIYASGASTPARLGIGTTGQVLSVSGGIPAWTSPSSSSQNFTLLNTGGTTLSGTSTTVSGISAKGTLYIMVHGAVTGTANSNISLLVNSDTGSNYRFARNIFIPSTTYSQSIFDAGESTATTNINLGRTSTAGTSSVSTAITISGANSSGVKPIVFQGGATRAGGDSAIYIWGGGMWTGSATVSSISITTNAGSFSAGTVFVYASA